MGVRIIYFVVLSALLAACKGFQKTPAGAWQEPHRPQYHFSPPKQWMNDPNGMVFFAGEYHLFYQFYPDSNVWGPMHWAHAVSKDLVHWEHLPIALYPDKLGYIFSGSAVVDWNNTSGFGQNGQPPLVAIFTYHDIEMEKAGKKNYESQAIAYSTDKGRTWTKYAGNPVIPNPGNIKDFRDPKVIWDHNSKQWVMALAVGDHAEFWGSPNLKNWAFLSSFGEKSGAHAGVWECPDFFPMPTTDAAGNAITQWVLIQNINPGGPNGGSAAQYFVGQFDGKTFTPEPASLPFITNGKALWLDYGRDNYAGVTWSDMPQNDQRRILLGWMSNWDYAMIVPTQAWRSANTLPRELMLKNTPDGHRLWSVPAREVQKLRGKSYKKSDFTIENAWAVEPGFSPTLSEVELDIDLKRSTARRITIELSNSRGERYQVGYDVSGQRYFSDRTKAGDHRFSEKFAPSIHYAPRFVGDDLLRLHLFFDWSSAELFADGGSTSMTELFFPSEKFDRIKIISEGGKVHLQTTNLWQLKSVWK